MLALLACVVVLAGLALVALLLVKLDARKCLRQIKVDARIGRWFGLAIQVDREAGRDAVAATSNSVRIRRRGRPRARPAVPDAVDRTQSGL